MATTTFTGRVTMDPEIKYGPSGKAVLGLNVAENHRRKNPQTEQWEDSGTTWRRVTLFGPHAENAADQLTKGSLITVTGREQTREYTKQDGTPGSSLEVLADEVGVVIPRWAPRDNAPAPVPAAAPAGGGWGEAPAPSGWGGAPSGQWDTPDSSPTAF
ncbi:single-stranded DNA-binding protein [Nesterenkonia suensis]